MYTLLCGQMDNAPDSLRVDVSSFAETPVCQGDAVWLDGNTLIVGDQMRICLLNLEVWGCVLPQYPQDTAILSRNLATTIRHFQYSGRPGGLLISHNSNGLVEHTLTERLAVLTARLMNAITCNDTAPALDCAKKLLGLGVGLTPSGDDFLVGLFTVLNMPANPFSQFGEWCRQVAEAARTRTNEISGVALRQAAFGNVRESVVQLVQAMAYESEGGIVDSLERVMNIGSSSGTDIVSGIIHGFRASLAVPQVVNDGGI